MMDRVSMKHSKGHAFRGLRIGAGCPHISRDGKRGTGTEGPKKETRPTRKKTNHKLDAE